MLKIYLSGGMRLEWREKIKQLGPSMATYLNPCDHGYDDPKLYSAWDARAVDACDILFAYLEADNPSGYGMVAEIGRACVQGKLIIFVDEKTAQDRSEARYLPIVREWSHIVVDTLDEGIDHLQKFAEIYR